MGYGGQKKVNYAKDLEGIGEKGRETSEVVASTKEHVKRSATSVANVVYSSPGIGYATFLHIDLLLRNEGVGI